MGCDFIAEEDGTIEFDIHDHETGETIAKVSGSFKKGQRLSYSLYSPEGSLRER